jgi:hypothetical protein
MPRYQVIGKALWIYEAFFEADNDEAAQEIAKEMNEKEFEILETHWKIGRVIRLPEPKQNASKKQTSLF